MICSCQNCDNEVESRGWCKPHYDAWYRTGDPHSYLGDRSYLTLWDKIQEIGWVRTPSGCLEYNGFRNEHGYGLFRDGRGPLKRVHRVVYEKLIGPLSDEDEVLHICDNPPCGEPSHLTKGTHTDNMRDMRAKKRGYKDGWTQCPNGHPYPPDRPAGIDKNRCRECANERNRKYFMKKKGLVA